MTPERDVRGAVRDEFGDRVAYHRPEWSRFEGGVPMGENLSQLDAAAREGLGIAALVPARTETAWAHDYCFPWEVRFLRGRVRFPGRGRGGAPFPSMVVVMGPPARPEQVFGWDLRHYGQGSLFLERLVRWPNCRPWVPA